MISSRGAGTLARKSRIAENSCARNYELPSRSARNKAAVRSSGSARPGWQASRRFFTNAARSASSCVPRLQIIPKCFALLSKAEFPEGNNSVSGTRSASSRGLMVIRTTLECTLGGGENAQRKREQLLNPAGTVAWWLKASIVRLPARPPGGRQLLFAP